MKILFADDDEGMRTLVEHIFKENGYEYICAKDGEEALGLFEREHPDMVLLDVVMPKLDGYEVCGRLRTMGQTVPIIMLTAKGDIVDKSVGFRMGADDYLVKPFVSQELLLRMEALARRSLMGAKRTLGSDVLKLGGLELDAVNHRVVVRGDSIVLTPKEFQLLAILASNPGQVYSHKELTEEIWGESYTGEITSITVLVHRLRGKIEEDPANPQFVQTVWHAGYRFGSA